LNDVKMIVILGPTGIGKSEIALEVAKSINGEIINFDSRQIYKGMDIGTATPSLYQQSLIKHHLYSFIAPDQYFNVYEFLKIARATIKSIQVRGNTPILVGGTGQYIWALLENWSFPGGPPDLTLRNQLETRLQNNGLNDLLSEYKSLGLKTVIDLQNPRRLIRAIEKHYTNNNDMHMVHSTDNSNFLSESLIIGLTLQREKLYTIVNKRICKMYKNGFVDEVRTLISMGYDKNLPSMSSIGYKETTQLIDGSKTIETCINEIVTKTHKYIRTQYNWFRLDDTRIKWYEKSEAKQAQIIDKIIAQLPIK